MSASLIGRLRSSTSRLSATAMSMSPGGLVLLFGIGTRALPSWDSRTRWNNLSGGLVVSLNGRFKRTCELTSSIVPRGTFFHCWVDLEFSPIGFDPEWFSCCCRGRLPGPPELGAVNPDAVHDHRQPARQRHDRLLHPAVPGDLHRPSLEPGPLRRTHQHALGRFVEHDPHHLISAPRYCTGSVVLARLILGGCESKHRPHRLGLPEAGRYIDGDAIGQSDHRANAGD